MKTGIDFMSEPVAKEIQPSVHMIIAAGEDPFDYDYCYSTIPVGNYSCPCGYRFVVALYRH